MSSKLLRRASGFGGDAYWSQIDGRVGASGGTAQYPNLLDNYPASAGRLRAVGGSYQVADPGRRQPPWMVAGVDYRVGIQAGKTLKPVSNGTGFTPEFTQFRTDHAGTGTFASRSLRFDNQNIWTIEEWDFTTDGGFTLFLVNCSNTTVRNCKFGGNNLKNATNVFGLSAVNMITHSPGSGGVGMLVEYNEFDFGMTEDNFVSGQGSILSFNCGGATPSVVQYNWFKNSSGLFTSVFSYPSGGVCTIQYNLLDECFQGQNLQAYVTAVNNNGGAMQIQTSVGLPGWVTGTSVWVSDVNGAVGTVPPNGNWTITNNNPGTDTLFTLQGSVFGSFVYTGRGLAGGGPPSLNKHSNYGQMSACVQTYTWKFNTSKCASSLATGPQFTGSPDRLVVSNVIESPTTPGISRVIAASALTPIVSGTLLVINGVKGATSVNGEHLATKITTSSWDLPDAPWGAAYTSGGTIQEAMHIKPTCTNNTTVLGGPATNHFFHGTNHAGAGTITAMAVSPTNPPWIRVTASSVDPAVLTDDIVMVRSAVMSGSGGVGPNGRWFVTKIDSTHYDLQGTDMGAQTYVSGGKIWDADTVTESPSIAAQNFFAITVGVPFYNNPNWDLWDSFTQNINMLDGSTIPMPTPG